MVAEKGLVTVEGLRLEMGASGNPPVRSRTLLEVIVIDPDLVIGATGGRRARIVAARDLVPGARLARAVALETVDQPTTLRLQLWS